MAGALRAGVDVPCLPLHEILSSGCVANRGSAELWFLHHKVICAGRAALSRTNGGVATGRHRAGDEGTHFPSIVTVALPAPIMPAFLIFMMMAIHGQTCA